MVEHFDKCDRKHGVNLMFGSSFKV